MDTIMLRQSFILAMRSGKLPQLASQFHPSSETLGRDFLKFHRIYQSSMGTCHLTTLASVPRQSISPANINSLGMRTVVSFARPGSDYSGHDGGFSWGYLTWLGLILGIGSFTTYWGRERTLQLFMEAHAATSGESPSKQWPVFKRTDISRHNVVENGGIWCSFDGKVYDITNFHKDHPGGDKILLAAGGALEPFWNLYAVHKTPEVFKMLDALQIGIIDPDDDAKDDLKDLSNPYAADPKRHPALKPAAITPFNAETPAAMLPDSFQTPNDLFFVRNHLPVPEVDMADYRLEVGGLGMSEKEFSLDQLKAKFKPVKFNATLQCAGNRRNEFNRVREVKGLKWGHAAISNAEWTGVRLRDVLLASGFDEKSSRYKHIHFEGLDYDPTGDHYGASIPVAKALAPDGDVILAYEMNGQPLPKDHGYPLRVIVPGTVGARNVKWLSRIYASEKESPAFHQQNDYKLFSPSIHEMSGVDFTSAPAIQEAPVQSAICDPADKANIPKGKKTISVRGYAWSGGGRGIVRVDVSADGGRTWHTARLRHDPNQSLTKAWAWTLWEVAELPLPPVGSGGTAPQKLELVCKAVDSSYNNQPDEPGGIWNVRGCLNNSWNRVHLDRL